MAATVLEAIYVPLMDTTHRRTDWDKVGKRPSLEDGSRQERTSRVVGLARATSLVPTLLAHGKATALADLGVTARTLAYRRSLGWGHGDASIDFVELLVDAALPLVIPPIGLLARRSTGRDVW